MKTSLSMSLSTRRSAPIASLRLLGYFAIAAIAVSGLAGCATSVPEGLTPIDNFDAERYTGTWYEVARLDHRFERGLTHVTAQYELKEDGSISVINRGFDTEDGEWEQAEGKARFRESERTGSLEVSFFGPFYGGYHILAVDEDASNYRYSLVAGADRSYLWILSRTPELPQSVIDRLLAQARESGFPVQDLIFVPQTSPPGA